MATYISMAQYRKVMEHRIKALIQSGDRSSLSSAKHQVMLSKKNAPRKSGVLRGNIRKRKLKSGRWVAESWVPGKFKYNMWVNKNIKTVRLPTVYFKNIGKWPTSKYRKRHGAEKKWLYSQTNHSGLPGYWDLATNKTRRHFNRVAVKNARKSLRITT